jgi:hypothetical protein
MGSVRGGDARRVLGLADGNQVRISAGSSDAGIERSDARRQCGLVGLFAQFRAGRRRAQGDAVLTVRGRIADATLPERREVGDTLRVFRGAVRRRIEDSVARANGILVHRLAVLHAGTAGQQRRSRLGPSGGRRISGSWSLSRGGRRGQSHGKKQRCKRGAAAHRAPPGFGVRRPDPGGARPGRMSTLTPKSLPAAGQVL